MKLRPLTLRVGEADSESFGSGGGFSIVCGDLPDPTTVRANVRLELHVRGDCKVAHFSAHDVEPAAQNDAPMWFAQTLRVLSRRITSRTFLDCLFCSSLTSPVPRSFHSFDSETKRKSFARLHAAAVSAAGRRRRRGIARTS